MIIDCISDLHGEYLKLEGGDLLIVAGDLTAHDKHAELAQFYIWLENQNYQKKIVIAGNHDNYFYNCHSFIKPSIIPFSLLKTEYLCDSGTEFQHFYTNDRGIMCGQNFKIWGSPWTLRFKGMNPKCMAFTVETEEELAEKWKLIPDDVNILVTHCPPRGFLDKIKDYYNGTIINLGSKTLRDNLERIKPMLHVFGHIHECGGKVDDLVHYENLCGSKLTTMVNASHVNELYDPVNKPVRVEL